MRKNKIVSIFLLLVVGMLIISFTSCTAEMDIPYGVWRSTEPNMTLYITTLSEDIGGYTGEYISDTGKTTLRVQLDLEKGNAMHIFNPAARKEEGGFIDGVEHELFSGWLSLKDNLLIYKLISTYQEKTGYKEILFEKIGDYSPPYSLAPIVADVVKKPNGVI